MSQSTFGKKFTVTTWGESHGKALGAVVDGVPAGLFLTETDIQAYLDRRKPGQSRYTTARNEGDEVEILSGVFEGQTTGTPISMIVRNKDQRSHDYGNIANTYRPGHADFGFDSKYGIRDYRGGRDVPPDVKPSQSCCRCYCSKNLEGAWHHSAGLYQLHRTCFLSDLPPRGNQRKLLLYAGYGCCQKCDQISRELYAKE